MSYLQRLGRSLRALRRIGVLTCLFIPAGVLMPVAYATQNVAPRISDVTWEYILYGIEVAGPTFIKLSQVRSSIIQPLISSPLFTHELRFTRRRFTRRSGLAPVPTSSPPNSASASPACRTPPEGTPGPQPRPP